MKIWKGNTIRLIPNSKKKISKTRTGKCTGKNHFNWKGGTRVIPFEKEYGLNIVEWQNLATEIRKRDEYTCQNCNHFPSFVVHHIVPRNIKTDNSNFNLIPLCEKCHPKIEAITNKYFNELKKIGIKIK